jgi:hypothetical protein
MRVFVDFEASSLGGDGYPIEIGWAAEDGACEAHLIRPAPGWTDWDALAEAVHGISRERLAADGEAPETVARRTLEALQGHALFASAPSWDGKWMSVLLRAGGLARHALRLRDSDEACREAVAEAFGGALPAPELDALAAALTARARRAAAARRPRHRALADAQGEREIWREVRRAAEARARGPAAGPEG